MKKITIIVIVLLLGFSSFVLPETADGIDLADQFSRHFLDYMRMYEALILYEDIMDKGGWPYITDGPVLKRADYGERVFALRKRLQITGDLSRAKSDDQYLFDKALEDAVQKFQYRHGLKVDGVVGNKTLGALNISPEERIKQILLNMKRMWQFTENPGNRYIIVNIPEFKLRVIEDGEINMESRVIVGRKERQTPILSDEITFLVFNPSWRIPEKIAIYDMLPKIRKSPEYLADNNIKVFKDWNYTREIKIDSIDWSGINASNFSFKLKQEPGPDNQLGRVKFIFPNKYEVYIHDTPYKYLFDLDYRALSSGCVRIKKSQELAEYLLGNNPEWTEKRISKLLDSGKERNVKLIDPVPVYFVYWTVWVTDAGIINFRNDIYNRDKP